MTAHCAPGVRPYARPCVQPAPGAQAPSDRPGHAQRGARRDAAPQAPGPADLRLRPALLGRLRDPGDPAGAHRRWRRLPQPDPVGRGRCGRADGGRGDVLPPGGARLPQRGRLLRGGVAQPGCQLGPGGGRLAAGRLRDDGRRLGGLRRGQHHLRAALAGGPPGGAGGRLRLPADGGEPARCPRVRQGLRRADLPVHRRHPADGGHRAGPGGARRRPGGGQRRVRDRAGGRQGHPGRAGAADAGSARLRLRLHGVDRGGGDLQRRAGCSGRRSRGTPPRRWR